MFLSAQLFYAFYVAAGVFPHIQQDDFLLYPNANALYLHKWNVCPSAEIIFKMRMWKKFTFPDFFLYLFPKAAVTSYHRLGGL